MKKIVIGLITVVIILSVFLLYTIIQNGNTKKISFNLIGDKNITIYENANYIDEGFSAYFADGKTLKEYVKTVNNVNANIIGNYEIVYTLKYKNVTKELIRYVNVINDPIKDINLVLNGREIVYLLKGNNYVDSGINAVDKIDGEISNVILDGEVNTTEVGTYEVKYTVTNSRGVSKSITRKVKVYDFDYDVIVKKDDIGMKLVFKTTNEYIKGISIDGKDFEIKNLEYDLTEDKEYNVKVLDIYGNYKEKTYDLKKPMVSCNGEITMSGTRINAKASDNSGIKKYYYYLNNSKYESTNNTYSVTNYIDNVSIEVTDNNDNYSQKIACNIINSVPFYDSGLKEIGRNTSVYKNLNGYYLYVPEKVRLYEKRPLIIFLHGSDEAGTSHSLISNHGFIKSIIENNKKYDAYILTPQLISGLWDGNYEVLHKLIEDLKGKYNIDPNKISASGFSRGATGIVYYLRAYPNYFSSVTLISFGRLDGNYAKYLSKIPTQMHYGLNDTFATSDAVKSFIKQLEKTGNVTATGYKGYSHTLSFVNLILNNDKNINWMLSQTKK